MVKIILVSLLIFNCIALSQSKINIESGAMLNVLYGSEICADTINVSEGASYITQDTTGTCAQAVITGEGTIILPVELIHFRAEVTGKEVNIVWTTATEKNNLGFEIERKIPGNDFQRVGYVEGNGTSLSVKEYYFKDIPPLGSNKYFYRLKQLDYDGSYNYSEEIELFIIPSEFKLHQNFPNPFNPVTSIRYDIPYESRVKIYLYNSLGELVKIITDNFQSAGYHEVIFNAGDLSSGIYFYTIIAEQEKNAISQIATKKLVLLK